MTWMISDSTEAAKFEQVPFGRSKRPYLSPGKARFATYGKTANIDGCHFGLAIRTKAGATTRKVGSAAEK